MQSAAFDCFMEDMCAIQGVDVRRCFENSFCLSADVTAAFDPLYPEAYEKSNDAKLNYGMGICKITGARQVRDERRFRRGGRVSAPPVR